MGLFVSTTGVNVNITELGYTVAHPTTDLDLSAQFTAEDLKTATSLTAAIIAGTLVWRKVAAGAIQTPANYDPDWTEAEQLAGGSGASADRLALNSAVAGNVPSTRQIIAGTGMTGGGDFSADRTLAIANTGVAAGTYGRGFGATYTVNAQGQITAVVDGAIRRAHRLTSTQAMSSTTYTPITGLTTQSLPVGNYAFTVMAKMRSAAMNNGVGLRFNQNSAVVSDFCAQWHIPIDDNFQTSAGFGAPSYASGYTQNAITDNQVSSRVIAANTDFLCIGWGFFTVTTAGTVQIEMRSENGGTAITIGVASFLEIVSL